MNQLQKSLCTETIKRLYKDFTHQQPFPALPFLLQHIDFVALSKHRLLAFFQLPLDE